MRFNLRKIISAAFIIPALCIGITFAQEFQKFNGEITDNNINIRTDSTVGSDIICVLNRHDQVEITAELYDWYKIRLPKSAPSFVKKSLFECMPNQPPHPLGTPIPSRSETACVSAKAVKDKINVRLKASENSQILGKVKIDEIVNVLADSNGWLKIEPIRDSFGFVNKKFVKKLSDIVNLKQDLSPLVPEQPVQSLVIVTGIVQPYGKIFARKATHKLLSGDKTYLLKGNKQSLDSINYQKVKVTGKINDTKQKYPIIEIASIEAVK